MSARPAGAWESSIRSRCRAISVDARAAVAQPCSVLPSCLPPRRWYLFSVQQAVLVLLLSGVSLRRCADIVGTLWGPARSTMRRWRLGLEARHAQFSFHLLTAHRTGGMVLDSRVNGGPMPGPMNG